MKYITVLLLIAGQTLALEPARAPKGAERELVTSVIIAESGGHGRKGMAAVYEVIFERASRRGTTCATEALRYKQFSCLNGKGSAGKRATALWWKHRKHPEYKWVHDELLKWVPITSHTGLHPFARCTHYHAVSAAPYWAKGIKPAFTFGGHHWYNNIK